MEFEYTVYSGKQRTTNLGVIFRNVSQKPFVKSSYMFSIVKRCFTYSFRTSKLQNFSGKELIIECLKNLFDLDTLLDPGGNHLKDLPIFWDKIIHLNIGERLSLEWEKLENWIYKRSVEFVKSDIQTCFGFVSPIVAALTKLFNPALLPNLMNHTTYLTHEINVIYNLLCDEYTRFENSFQKQELEEHITESVNFYM